MLKTYRKQKLIKNALPKNYDSIKKGVHLEDSKRTPFPNFLLFVYHGNDDKYHGM